MEKLHRGTSKTFLKMDGGRMHTLHPIPLDLLLAISYRNHQKNLAYFSHLVPLVLFFFTKRQSQKGEGHGAMASPLNTLLIPVYTSISRTVIFDQIKKKSNLH